MTKNLVSEIDEIFRPRSVAVVGVSDKVNRLGNLLLYSFVDIGFEGEIYPINPKEETVISFKSYPSARDVESPVDPGFLEIILFTTTMIPQLSLERVV